MDIEESKEKKVCRICLQDEDEEPNDATENAFISPCNCKGTSKHVHVHCLRSWIESKHHKAKPTLSAHQRLANLTLNFYNNSGNQTGANFPQLPLRGLEPNAPFSHILNRLHLNNRLVMSTLTRLRALGTQNLNLNLPVPNPFSDMNRNSQNNVYPPNTFPPQGRPNPNLPRQEAPENVNPTDIPISQAVELLTLGSTQNLDQIPESNFESDNTNTNNNNNNNNSIIPEQTQATAPSQSNASQGNAPAGRQSCAENYNYTNFCCDICKEILPFTIKLDNDWEIESVKIKRPENTPYMILERITQAKEPKVISVIKGNEQQEVRMVLLVPFIVC